MASNKIRFDVVALIVVLALMLSGVLTVGEALSGFGSPVVILVAALLVIGEMLDRTGVAGYWSIDGRQQSYNVFVTPGSLAAGLSGVDLPAGVAPPEVALAFSNVGGVEASVPLTDRAVEVIDEAVGGAASVQPVKREVIEQAETVAEQLSQLYFTMGMLAVAAGILPRLNQAYRDKGVELRGCAASREIDPQLNPASDEDWDTEYLAPILSIRVVDGIDAAIDHINTHSSQHTESIITENYTTARRFLREVDSSSVMVNASTRFADGFEYGLGAEIGISTDKLHARGPVGLEGLTSQKYVVLGDGHIRE